MPTNTYVALDKVTVGSAVSSITFSSINQTYTDLVVVANIIGTVDSSNIRMTFNGDSSALYSPTWLAGSGSSATSGRDSGQTSILLSNGPLGSGSSTSPVVFNASIQSYTNTNVYKTVLSRYGTANATYSGTLAQVSLYRSLNAITSITMTAQSTTFAVGSTFSLYGIRAEGVSPAPKATGGAIYSDSQYYYHVFGSTGTFTPLQSLSADVLVVAGGGGGGGGIGGGGGAGGFRTASAQSLTTTAYTITVGAGGAGGSSSNAGTSGVNSSVAGSGFTTFTSSGGGGGAGQGTSQNAVTGGSGGGGTYNKTSGAAGNSGSYSPVEGYAGGNGLASNPYFAGGGGGGAGAVGSVAVTTTGGAGGAGNNALTTWIAATGIGVNGFLAGGGGGGSQQPTGAGAGGSGGGGIGGLQTAAGADVTRPGNGVANTGSGGGGDGTSGSGPAGSGGSGIVIVRYAK